MCCQQTSENSCVASPSSKEHDDFSDKVIDKNEKHFYIFGNERASTGPIINITLTLDMKIWKESFTIFSILRHFFFSVLQNEEVTSF